MTSESMTKEAIVAEMRAMVAKYSNFSDVRCSRPSVVNPNHLVVLVTGTTGALGSYVVDALLRDPHTRRVYALNRKGRYGLMHRQRMEFINRGLDPKILDLHQADGKLVLLEGDLTREDLGLPTSVLDELSGSVTRVMHNAWPVNFLMSFRKFEPMYKGLHNLVNFSLAATYQPTILFTSTYTTYQGGPPAPNREKERRTPPEWAVSTGYAESKWIAEEILANASKAAGLPTLNVRIGQLTGGYNGCWNRKEWVPSVVISSATLGCFPECRPDKTVGFMPLALGAKACLEFMHQSVSGETTVNLVPPEPPLWNDMARMVAKELGIPLIPIEDWFKKLHALEASLSPKALLAIQRGDSNTMALPILRLRYAVEAGMVFAARRPYTDATGSALLDTEIAQRLSASLSDPKQSQIRAEDVRNWLKFWGVSNNHARARL